MSLIAAPLTDANPFWHASATGPSLSTVALGNYCSTIRRRNVGKRSALIPRINFSACVLCLIIIIVYIDAIVVCYSLIRFSRWVWERTCITNPWRFHSIVLKDASWSQNCAISGRSSNQSAAGCPVHKPIGLSVSLQSKPWTKLPQPASCPSILCDSN